VGANDPLQVAPVKSDDHRETASHYEKPSLTEVRMHDVIRAFADPTPNGSPRY
jgi:hypothetical protein